MRGCDLRTHESVLGLRACGDDTTCVKDATEQVFEMLDVDGGGELTRVTCLCTTCLQSVSIQVIMKKPKAEMKNMKVPKL